MDFSSLHNYYERLVIEYIAEHLVARHPDRDDEFFQDVACYALTRLPARYIRHDIDMAFFLAPGERRAMLERVADVVDGAAAFIDARRLNSAGDWVSRR